MCLGATRSLEAGRAGTTSESWLSIYKITMKTEQQLTCPYSFDGGGAIDRSVQEFAGAFSSIHDARWWAFVRDDPENWLGGGSIIAAINANRDGRPTGAVLAETLQALCSVPQYGSNVLKPALPEIPKTPEVPTDPSTGAPLPNPYLEKDEKKKLRLLADLRSNRPDLDAHFKAMFERPFSYLAQLKKQKEEIEHERKIADAYDSTMHCANGFASGDLLQQKLVMQNDPIAAKVFQKEAVPAKLDLMNQTRLALLTKSHPATAAIVAKAQAQLKQWQRAIKQQEAEARARKRAEAIEMRNLLGEEQRRPISGVSPGSPLQPVRREI
jgi:hypothetical protein